MTPSNLYPSGTGASSFPTTDELRDRAHETVNRAPDRVDPALRSASNAAHETIDKVADAAEPTTEWAAEKKEELASKGNELVDALSNCVREQPLACVLGAFAIGYVAARVRR